MVDFLFVIINRIRQASNAMNNIKIDRKTTEKLIRIGVVHGFKIFDRVNDISVVKSMGVVSIISK